ncbi:MAG: DUF1657 domain-containing protein [Halanaerobiaceae bacterium]
MSSEKQLQEAIQKLKNAKNEIEAFSMETRDKNAEQLYKDGAQQIKQVVNSIQGRSEYVDNQNNQQRKQHNDLDAN